MLEMLFLFLVFSPLEKVMCALQVGGTMCE